jgi:predicted nucleic acid-binding protein
VIVVDTGPLVAAANHDDRDHGRCVDLMGGAARARRPLLVPAPVIAEVCYLLERERGSRIEAAFLRSFRGRSFTLVALTLADLDRMAELVDQYADLPLGGVDAAVIAIAERLNVTDVATLDRRHFSIVRPRHTKAFTLLPA